jgi:hypothetical protein
MDLSNSFYYFFSAAPQVLGALLGLFGVLVIFKMQSVKNNLIGISTGVVNSLKYEIINGDSANEDYYTHVARSIYTGISANAITVIEKTIQEIEIKNGTSDKLKEVIESVKDAYSKEREVMDELIKATIFVSIETVVLIIICLTVLPFGEFILKSIDIFFFIVIMVIGFIIHDLIGFVKLLRITLNTWVIF